MSKKEAMHEWESKHSSPQVTVQMPTTEAIKSVKKISKNVKDDFMSAMLSTMSDTVTIRSFGYSPDQIQSISLKVEDARDLANWILENTKS